MLGFGKKKVELVAPFAGQVVPVDQVPDEVFAGRMLGDGFAVIPSETADRIEVVAPVAGKLVQLFGTKHAFAIVSPEGLEVLVHIGLDTVELGGEGFVALAAKGDQVSAGQPIVRMDVASVRTAGRNPITPVVFTKVGQVADLRVNTGQIGAGAQIAKITLA